MKTVKTKSDFRDFLSGYIECALWSSTDITDHHEEPLDVNYDQSDITLGGLLSMARDCRAFMRECAVTLADYAEAKGTNEQWSWAECAGHDFWLTRNRHGSGFWDRGLGQTGSSLTDAAHVYGSSDIYVGDDGKLYVT